MTVDWAVALTGLIGAVGGIVIGVLGYRRSRQVDKVSEQSGVATETRAGTAQIIDALNLLLDQVQEDNASYRADAKDFREAIRACAARVERVSAERDEAIRELAETRRELNAFRRRYPDDRRTS